MTLKDDAVTLAAIRVLKERITGMEAEVRESVLRELLSLRDAVGMKSSDILLPSGEKVGTLSLVQPKAAGIVVTDEAAAAAVLESVDVSVLEWHSPQPGYYGINRKALDELAPYLKDDGNGGVVTDGGEPIPGLTFERIAPEPKSFRYAPNKENADALVAFVVEELHKDALGEPSLFAFGEQPALAGGE